jgi:hypothetical protein
MRARQARRGEPRPVTPPLLAALDHEYARATKAKDVDRMQEISRLIEAITGGPPKALEAVSAPARPALPPPPPTAPGAPAAPEKGWSIEELLKAASAPPAAPPSPPGILDAVQPIELPAPPQEGDGTPQFLPPPPVDDVLTEGARRRAAKASVRNAVAAVTRHSYDEQIRWEMALQARNQNPRAMSLFEDEAAALGCTIAELAEQIIQQRLVRERRVMRAWALQAEALNNLNKATGANIDSIAAAVVAELQGDTT